VDRASKLLTRDEARRIGAISLLLLLKSQTKLAQDPSAFDARRALERASLFLIYGFLVPGSITGARNRPAGREAVSTENAPAGLCGRPRRPSKWRARQDALGFRKARSHRPRKSS
jgi:hypothetical protein